MPIPRRRDLTVRPLQLHDVAQPMNNRSTLASANRARSGHRYRDENEPFAHADQGRRSFPSSNNRYASAAGAAAGYGAQHDAGQHDEAPSWSANNEWSQQDSWSDGGAWASNDSWAPDADASWDDANAAWSPET